MFGVKIMKISRNKSIVVLVSLIFLASSTVSVFGVQNSQSQILENSLQKSFSQNLLKDSNSLIELIEKIINFLIELLFPSVDEDPIDDQYDTDDDDDIPPGDDDDDAPEEHLPLGYNPIGVNKTVKVNCCGKYVDYVTVKKGEWVTFKIEVENSGPYGYWIVVKDDLPDGLVYNDNAMVNGVPQEPDEFNGDYYWNVSLYSHSTVTITFEAIAAECGEHENLVNISNYYECDDIFCEDTAIVNVPCGGKPGIRVVKTADPTTIEVGETVTWNITVNNTGDVLLFDVIVEDTNGGVSDIIPFLDVGEKVYYEYTTNPIVDIVNVVRVEGRDEIGTVVFDRDSASVKVVYPCAPEVWVDDNWYGPGSIPGELVWGYTAFNNIQDAIDVVCPCGTVHVHAGSYYGQILINKSLALLGDPGAAIYGNALDTFTIDGNPETYKPIIFAYAGSKEGDNVITQGKIGVTVDGFEIKGGDEQDIIAIMYHNVETGCIPSIISNNYIKDVFFGIVIDGCSDDTTIVHNKIRYYAKHAADRVAMLIRSDFQECEPINVEVHYNYIYGAQCAGNIGLWNMVETMVNATFNWWANDDGPASPKSGENYDYITGRIADGSGDRVIGNVHFDPWWGIDAYGEIRKITKYLYVFDASDSFAYDESGDISDRIKYKWNFDDGYYSFKRTTGYSYKETGTFHPSLRVKVNTYDLDEITGYLVDYADFKVTV
jgi:hypothetical protein